jgi:hypothetical protein
MGDATHTQLVLDQLTKLNNNFQLLFNQMQVQMSFYAMNQVQPLLAMNNANPMFGVIQPQGQFQGSNSNGLQVSTVASGKPSTKLSDVTLVDPILISLCDRLKALPRDKGRYHRSFLKKYSLVLQFKQTYGHVKITASMHKVLSAWVKNQRTNLGNMYRHRGPLVGRPLHVELLNEVGILSYDDDDDVVVLSNDEDGNSEEE